MLATWVTAHVARPAFTVSTIPALQHLATYYKPLSAHADVPNWQAYLEWYRQVVAEVLEIAQETGVA